MSAFEHNCYQAFGLIIDSEIPLPELQSVAAGDANVTIRLGSMRCPAEFEGSEPSIVFTEGVTRLRVPGVACFDVSQGGTSVRVHAKDVVPEDYLRLYLLGTVLSIVLVEQGYLVLHGSVVEWGDGAVAFLGASGSGKSTLANAFRIEKGGKILSDDLCVLKFDTESVVWALSGYPQSKLNTESLKLLGDASSSYPEVGRKLLKRSVSIRSAFCGEMRKLKSMYYLDTHVEGTDGSFVELKGAVKLGILIENTYRRGVLSGLGQTENHFRLVSNVAGRVRLWRLRRDDLNGLLERIANNEERDDLKA